MTATLALMGEILTVLNLSEILPVYVAHILSYLSAAAVTSDIYCIFGRVDGAVENSVPYVENLPQ